MRSMPALAALAVLSLLGLAPAAHANLVANPGFEGPNGPVVVTWMGTGTGFPGWTVTGTGIFSDSTFPNSGSVDAAFTDLAGTVPPSTLSQIIATMPGTGYRLGFALLDESGLADDVFTVSFGGFTTVLTGNQAAPPGTTANFYTVFGFDVPGAAVTSGQTALRFTGTVDATNGTAFNLDDVSLVAGASPPASIPEPASAAVLGVAAVATLMARPGRRRRR